MVKILRKSISKIFIIGIAVPTLVLIFCVTGIEVLTHYLNTALLDFLHDVYILSDRIRGDKK